MTCTRAVVAVASRAGPVGGHAAREQPHAVGGRHAEAQHVAGRERQHLVERQVGRLPPRPGSRRSPRRRWPASPRRRPGSIDGVAVLACRQPPQHRLDRAVGEDERDRRRGAVEPAPPWSASASARSAAPGSRWRDLRLELVRSSIVVSTSSSHVAERCSSSALKTRETRAVSISVSSRGAGLVEPVLPSRRSTRRSTRPSSAVRSTWVPSGLHSITPHTAGCGIWLVAVDHVSWSTLEHVELDRRQQLGGEP